jgi:short-subunit dehydrogenase
MAIEDIRPLAVVTGGSSGIGYHLAKTFLENGYDVLIAADNAGKLGEAQQALEALGLGTVETCEVDLATPDGVEDLYETANELGPVDVLCCNAGHGEWGKFGEDTELDQELDLIQLNCSGVVHLTKLVLEDMLERDRGQILFTGSIAGTSPGPYQAVYHASKAFVNSFAHALRNELKDTGVDITLLMPGATDTEFFARAGMEEAKILESKLDDPEMVAQEAFKALQRGKDQIVTGMKNKVMTVGTKPMPEGAKAEMMRKQNEPREGEA